MIFDQRLTLVNDEQLPIWIKLINERYRDKSMFEWISSYHPQHLPCHSADSNMPCGSFNVGCKVFFTDGTIWFVRFPRAGNVHPDYADEKVAIEVAAIELVRQKTTIPVPQIIAWGRASDNPLGLGPFIIEEFIQGAKCLDEMLASDICEDNSRLLRRDLREDEIETLLRQMANYQLQLFQLDFEQIGNLPFQFEGFTVPARPLTMKAHAILQNGGINTFAEDSKHFYSTSEYFTYVISQDGKQLVKQENSAYTSNHFMRLWRSLKQLQSKIPSFVNEKWDKGKFKFICDDLGLANLMVRSREDLTVVCVLDLEWSYVGPAQLAATAPWWLLMDRPTNERWDPDQDRSAELEARWLANLEIYQRVLVEEEEKLLGVDNHEFSDLVQWSKDSGAMWFHIMLLSGFNTPDNFPYSKIIEREGKEAWEQQARGYGGDEVEAYSKEKEYQLAKYDFEHNKLKEQVDLIRVGEITRKEFVTSNLGLLNLKPPDWSAIPVPSPTDEPGSPIQED